LASVRGPAALKYRAALDEPDPGLAGSTCAYEPRDHASSPCAFWPRIFTEPGYAFMDTRITLRGTSDLLIVGHGILDMPAMGRQTGGRTGEAEPHIVVRIAVPVAVGHAQVARVVVPGAAAQDMGG
jgi:hypothetical protein